MTLILDASTVVAALIDTGPIGRWAEQQIETASSLVAPHLLPVEVANVVRRREIAGDITEGEATVAMSDLVTLPVEYHPFAPFARRVCELRTSVGSYDAWYVALAEAASAPLATCDLRLTRAPGPRCTFRTPPA